MVPLNAGQPTGGTIITEDKFYVDKERRMVNWNFYKDSILQPQDKAQQ